MSCWLNTISDRRISRLQLVSKLCNSSVRVNTLVKIYWELQLDQPLAKVLSLLSRVPIPDCYFTLKTNFCRPYCVCTFISVFDIFCISKYTFRIFIRFPWFAFLNYSWFCVPIHLQGWIKKYIIRLSLRNKFVHVNIPFQQVVPYHSPPWLSGYGKKRVL